MNDGRARPVRPEIVFALLVGLAVLLALFPASGIDRQPPECYSMWGYVVPCDAWVAWAAAAVAAALVAGALWMRGDTRP